MPRSLFSPLGDRSAVREGGESEGKKENEVQVGCIRRLEKVSETDGRKQSETRRRRRSGGGSIAASITSGERADSSEAICLSFRANLLRPGSPLSPFPYALFLLRSKPPSLPPSPPPASASCAPLRLFVSLALFSTPHHSATPHPTNVPHKTWYQRSSNGDLQSLQAPLSR